MAVSNSTDRFNGVVASLAIKAPCKAVATSNITLSGVQTIDGFSIGAGDRVLCVGQTNPIENGIYDADTSAWSRSPDFDGNRDVVKGTVVNVDRSSGGYAMYQVTSASPTIGTDAINFIVFFDPAVSVADAPQLDLKANNITAVSYKEASGHILADKEIHTGLTASTTQTQAGGLQLLSSYNEITTVANDGDSVVAPQAAAGRDVEIINHGTKDLWIWPSVGDDLGAGVDSKLVLEPSDSIELLGISASEFHMVATTEIFHGSMFDEGNTDAFVISDAGGDPTCYHSNGLAAGGELGWVFDVGGGGTSFPIASIADGADSGVDIAVTTTGAHGLAVGAIISQSNLADAAYVGVFVVKAVISSTIYEVAAVFTATGIGTMDEAATLTVAAEAIGEYFLHWAASATSATNNETFDFVIYKNATAIPGTSVRRKFGTATDFGSFSGLAPPFTVVAGDKISFVIMNTDSAGNITIRNLTILTSRV